MAVATIRLLVGFAQASRYFKVQLMGDLQLPESSFFSRKEKKTQTNCFAISQKTTKKTKKLKLISYAQKLIKKKKTQTYFFCSKINKKRKKTQTNCFANFSKNY